MTMRRHQKHTSEASRALRIVKRSMVQICDRLSQPLCTISFPEPVADTPLERDRDLAVNLLTFSLLKHER